MLLVHPYFDLNLFLWFIFHLVNSFWNCFLSFFFHFFLLTYLYHVWGELGPVVLIHPGNLFFYLNLLIYLLICVFRTFISSVIINIFKLRFTILSFVFCLFLQYFVPLFPFFPSFGLLSIFNFLIHLLWFRPLSLYSFSRCFSRNYYVCI